MHTLETLLPLLDSPEGLEKLRVLAAEADGYLWSAWNPVMGSNGCCYLDRTGIFTEVDIDLPRCENFNEDVPNYPTSLDAIFAAEERLGLHEHINIELRWIYFRFVDKIHNSKTGLFLEKADVAFLSPSIRCIAFILTAQYKKEKGL